MKKVLAAVALFLASGAWAQAGGAADAGVPAAAAPAPKAAPPPVFNRAAVVQVMMAHRDEVQQCYTDSLSEKYGKGAQKMNGRLTTTFVVNRKGHVKNAGILKDKSSVQDPGFRRCVVHILQGLTFPPPKDGRDHPIEFPYQLKVTR